MNKDQTIWQLLLRISYSVSIYTSLKFCCYPVLCKSVFSQKQLFIVTVNTRARKQYSKQACALQRLQNDTQLHMEQAVSTTFQNSFLMDERKLRMDIHPDCMDEWGRDCGDKQMFCLIRDFIFEPSRAMDRKYCLVR